MMWKEMTYSNSGMTFAQMLDTDGDSAIQGARALMSK
jgi:phage-related minor tail protein